MNKTYDVEVLGNEIFFDEKKLRVESSEVYYDMYYIYRIRIIDDYDLSISVVFSVYNLSVGIDERVIKQILYNDEKYNNVLVLSLAQECLDYKKINEANQFIDFYLVNNNLRVFDLNNQYCIISYNEIMVRDLVFDNITNSLTLTIITYHYIVYFTYFITVVLITIILIMVVILISIAKYYEYKYFNNIDLNSKKKEILPLGIIENYVDINEIPHWIENNQYNEIRL